MQDSTDTGNRPIILYIIIAAILFVALLFGVRWAKSRSSYYAANQASQNQQQAQDQNTGSQNPSSSEQKSTPQPADSQGSQQTTPSVGQTSPTSASANNQAGRVPSTGAEEYVIPIASLSAFMFALLSYARARRRLLSIAQQA